MRNIIRICLTVFIFFILVLAFGSPREMKLVERSSSIDDECLVGDKHIPDLSETLTSIKPELILLGNSMLGEAVGQEQISEALGVNSVKVWLGGSGSAWWYLVIKNIVSKLSHRPRYIGIFFRDNYLTLPQHKTSGKHKKGIDGFAGEGEEVLDQLAYFSSMNSVELAVQKYLPLFNHRTQLRETFEQNLKNLVAKNTGVGDVEKVNELISVTLDNAKMNSQMLHRRQIADELTQDEYRKDMSFHPERSFLEHIVTMCKEQDIGLFFVRVKRLRDLKVNKQSPELLKYISQLNAYLNEQNIPFIDFTDNRQILKKHFGKSDHLNKKGGRNLFTQLLAEQIKKNVFVQSKPLIVTVKVKDQNN